MLQPLLYTVSSFAGKFIPRFGGEDCEFENLYSHNIPISGRVFLTLKAKEINQAGHSSICSGARVFTISSKIHDTFTRPSRDPHGTLTRPSRDFQPCLDAYSPVSGSGHNRRTPDLARFRQNRRVGSTLPTELPVVSFS